MAASYLRLLVLVAGCGRIDFDVVELDAQTDAMLGEFSAPAVIGTLSFSNTTFDGDPWISPDLLEVYFASNRPTGVGDLELWTSRRTFAGTPWSQPTPIGELSTTDNETAPHLSGDRLTMWFSRGSGAPVSDDIWVTTRQAADALWEVPSPLTELNMSGVDDGGFAPTSNGLVAYFHSARGGTNDLYRTQRATAAGPWSPPQPVTELNTPLEEQNPFVSADDRVLFFSRGDATTTSIYMATRPSARAPFDPAVELTALRSGMYDSDPCLGDGLRYIMFSSNRSGFIHLYEATR